MMILYCRISFGGSLEAMQAHLDESRRLLGASYVPSLDRKDLISQLLNSSDPALQARALEYVDFGTEAVGSGLIKASAINQGELYAIQLALGIKKSQRVGFDPFSTLLKGSTISDGTSSDISVIGGDFADTVLRTLRGLNIVDDAGNITEYARTLGRTEEELNDILGQYRLAGQVINEAQDAAKSTSGSVVFRHRLLERYGLPKDRSYGTLADRAQEIQDIINQHMSKIDEASTRAISEIENITAVISHDGKTRINSYIDNLFSSSIEDTLTLGQELGKYDTLRKIYDTLNDLDSIKKSKHADLIETMDSILNTNFSELLSGEKSIVRKDYSHLLDTISAELKTMQDDVATRIVGDLQSIADADGGARAFTQLQLLLAKRREIASTALNIESPSSASQLGLGHILDQLFGADAANFSLKIGGVDYAFGDLVSLARNRTSIDLLKADAGGQTQATLDEVIGFLRSQSDTLTPETNVLGKQYLDDFLSYSTGRKYALKETGRLGSVPKFIQKITDPYLR